MRISFCFLKSSGVPENPSALLGKSLGLKQDQGGAEIIEGVPGFSNKIDCDAPNNY
jgi:hypothetical protein